MDIQIYIHFFHVYIRLAECKRLLLDLPMPLLGGLRASGPCPEPFIQAVQASSQRLSLLQGLEFDMNSPDIILYDYDIDYKH